MNFHGAHLVVPPTLWADVSGDLLATPELERAAVGFAGISGTDSHPRLLFRDWKPVPADEYIVQLGHHLEVSPQFWARAAKRARTTGEALVIMHSHPRDTRTPRFSGSDDFGEDRLIPKIHSRASVPVAATVISPGGVRGRITLPSARTQDLPIAQVIGTHRESHSDASMPEFDRQIRALGQRGQATLRAMTVAVVGVGGLGSHVLQQLLHLGIGRIIVVEPDRVDRSNLSRLVGGIRADALFRRHKTAVARRLARRLGHRSNLTALPESVTTAAGAVTLLDCDVIIGCTDNHWSRMVLNALAYQHYVPVLDLGVELQAGGALGGRVTWLYPDSACLWCLGILNGDRIRIEQLPEATRRAELAEGYIQGINEPAPAVVSINGVIASLAVTELLARFTGFAGTSARADLLLYRLSDGVVRRTCPPPTAGCSICSSAGLLGVGNLAPPPWAS
jgi:molybdopterin/thiamine biosynthesis adenylyltransferase